MNRREFIQEVGLGAAALGFSPLASFAAERRKRPNVLLIVCDDLNDYVNGFNGHPQARTPQLARFAETAASFVRAYSNNPICAPSRSSFLTGIYPHTSRNLFFRKWYENPVLRNSHTLMEYFRLNGYYVVGSGKLMHHLRREEWSEFQYPPDYGPFWYKDGKRTAHPNVPEPYRSIGPVDGSYGALESAPPPAERKKGEGWIYGRWGRVEYLRLNGPNGRDSTPDERNAAWAVREIHKLERSSADKPFFLGVGFIRPHTPLHVPRKYFDLFPLEKVKLPVLKADDAADTWYETVAGPDAQGYRYFRLLRESYGGTLEGLRAFTRAYLASVAAVDDCIGQVLDALGHSRFRDNTIVVVTSDHGWNMGEKDWLYKNAPWEQSCRVPLIIRAPGVSRPGSRIENPVSLIDLYPTLKDLCYLRGDTRKNDKGAPLDGHSLRPFLEHSERGVWDGPDAALSMIYAGIQYDGIPQMQHYSVRTRDYRYVRYNNGKEELYDHRDDPYEWRNLADRAEFAAIKERLRRKLDEMTGLHVGVLPPRIQRRLNQTRALEHGGVVRYTFEDFDVITETVTWPAKNRTEVTADPRKVLNGGRSLLLHGPGAPWNVVTFRWVQVPPGVSCRIRFACRALKVRKGGYLYCLLAQGRTKAGFTRIPLKPGETRTPDVAITNNQEVALPVVIGFAKGGTYVVDDLEVAGAPKP